MVRKRKSRGARSADASTGAEWVGGIVSLPGYVTGEGEPYRPETLLWMGANGAILGHDVARPGELLGRACESLENTIESPMCGPPHAPTRVRVASSNLAETLRAGHPAIRVVCAPTPELDEVFAAMREKVGQGDATEPSYLSAEVGPDAVASFFRAAAGLFGAAPWEVVPSDQDLFAVSIEALDVRAAAMSVIGQMEQNRGIVLFADRDDFRLFVGSADALQRGEEPELPPHLSLNFDPPTELPAEMQREVEEHHWAVAAENAYPWLVAVDEDLVVRPPTAREVAVGEAIALALPKVLAEEGALQAALEGGPPVTRTQSVRTHQGDVEVTLSVPYERAVGRQRPPDGLLADLFDLASDPDAFDSEERTRLEDELLEGFEASPEAERLSDLQACGHVMEYAAGYFGETIATLDPADLIEIIFVIIPRKVVLDASEARPIIEACRAFYAFLNREFELAQAEACLRVLGRGAVRRLEGALSDRRNFGMAKSMVMAGRDAGFDVDTKEGLEAWMRAQQGMPLPPAVRGPTLGAPAPNAQKAARRVQKKAQKKKRKAARKARKKNR